MSSTSGSTKSPHRTHSGFSCISKRPDSSAFESGDITPRRMIKRSTISVTDKNRSLSNHRDSGATLDDASSLVDQSYCATPLSQLVSSKPSLGGNSYSHSDLLGIKKQLSSLTINQRESIYVRALFRYDPSSDRGLAARGVAFEHGDILYVVNASDPEWWQARYAFPVSYPAWSTIASNTRNSPESPPTIQNDKHNPSAPLSAVSSNWLGIIPSQRRVERRNRVAAKRVKFVDREIVIGGGNNPWNFLSGQIHQSQQQYPVEGNQFFDANTGSSASLSAMGAGGDGSYTNGDSLSVGGGTLYRRKKTGSFALLKRFSSRRDRKDLNESAGAMKKKSVSLEDIQARDSAVRARLSRTYEIVQAVTLKMARPLILFGALKERITDELLQQSNEFATCIQHTSRPPLADERDGVDYHFYSSKAAMQADISKGGFLDVIIQSDHFYATSVQSIVEVLQSGRICILDVNIMTIYRLQAAGLNPITVLLKPETVMQWRSIQRRLTVDQARRLHESCLQMESEHWYLFTAILNLESLESAVVSLNRILLQHRGPRVWLPADQTPENAERS